jgi:hypothetical protein
MVKIHHYSQGDMAEAKQNTQNQSSILLRLQSFGMST